MSVDPSFEFGHRMPTKVQVILGMGVSSLSRFVFRGASLGILAFFFSVSVLSAKPSDLLARTAKLIYDKHYDAARALLEPYQLAHPKDPAVLFQLGSLEQKLGRPDRALAFWKRAYDIDPQSSGGEMLRMIAPHLASKMLLITDPEELRKIFEQLQDYRRQSEVERALARFTTKKGVSLFMQEGDWEVFLKFFYDYKYLDRPGGPPSGKGKYFSVPKGNPHFEEGMVYSTVFGSWRNEDGGPLAIGHKEGWSAPAGLIADAIASGQNGACEFGLFKISDGDLSRVAKKVGLGLYRLEDPWAIEAALDRFEAFSKTSSNLPPALIPALTRFVNAEEKKSQLRAQGLLRRFQHSVPKPVAAKDLPTLFVSIGEGEVPLETGVLALESLGTKADENHIALLDRASEKELQVLLHLAVKRDSAAVTKALIERLRSQDEKWMEARPLLKATLVALAGKDLGDDPKKWIEWSEGR